MPKLSTGYFPLCLPDGWTPHHTELVLDYLDRFHGRDDVLPCFAYADPDTPDALIVEDGFPLAAVSHALRVMPICEPLCEICGAAPPDPEVPTGLGTLCADCAATALAVIINDVLDTPICGRPVRLEGRFAGVCARPAGHED